MHFLNCYINHMLTLTCSICLKTFKRYKCHIRNETHSCSRACSTKIRRKPPKKWIHFTCKKCGQDAKRRKGSGGTFEYCSNRCRSLSATPKGERHPKWKGGVSGRTYRSKRIIRERINEIGRCERCGNTDNLNGHHRRHHSTDIDKREDADNIEVLCSVCHSKEHPGLENWILRPRRRTILSITCVICENTRNVRPYEAATAKYCGRECFQKRKFNRSSCALPSLTNEALI
jgi:hypothetical protein